MGELDGRVAIVTGASRGIGKMTAETFARQGANLAICARTAGPLEEAAEDLRQRFGVTVVAAPADILEDDSVRDFVAKTRSDLGRIDLLVNNAGESTQRNVDGVAWPVNTVDSVGQQLPRGRFEEIADTEYFTAFNQKILGMVRFVRASLPHLREADGGSIVNVSSIKGIQPTPRVTLSGVAWAAALNLTKSLSFELAGDNIRVNAISVGGIMTPQMEAGRQKWAPEKSLDEFLAPRVANIAMKRLGTVEEVAELIYFLSSPKASYITGQCVAVDGGGVRRI